MRETTTNSGIFAPNLSNGLVRITFLNDGVLPTRNNGILEMRSDDIDEDIIVQYADPKSATGLPKITSTIVFEMTLTNPIMSLPNEIPRGSQFLLEITDPDLNDDRNVIDVYSILLSGQGLYHFQRAGMPIAQIATIEMDIMGAPFDFDDPIVITLAETGKNTGKFQGQIDIEEIIPSNQFSIDDGDILEIDYDDYMGTVNDPVETQDEAPIRFHSLFFQSFSWDPEDWEKRPFMFDKEGAGRGSFSAENVIVNDSDDIVSLLTTENGSRKAEIFSEKTYKGQNGGVFEATLLLGSTNFARSALFLYDNKTENEIDIIEIDQTPSATCAYSTIHQNGKAIWKSDANPLLPGNQTINLKAFFGGKEPTLDPHKYRLEWTSTHLLFSIDGRSTFKVQDPAIMAKVNSFSNMDIRLGRYVYLPNDSPCPPAIGNTFSNDSAAYVIDVRDF
jgi:hypothetical protein